MNNQARYIIAALAAAAGGFAAGYVVARKQLEVKYEAMYQDEVAAMKTYSAMFQKTDKFESPVKAAEALGVVPPPAGVDPSATAEKLIRGLGYRGEKSVGVDALTRNRNKPYLIRQDEFLDNVSELEQKTLTYFKGDDTLCDEADVIINDVEKVVGAANLDCFGQLSTDPNTVYVRNERLRVEYEITLDHNTYAEVVAGFTKED